jgi:biofilm PGA synthesis N-glycosyltransferase PgaC
MSIIWMIGAVYFHFRYERNVPKYPALETNPLVSVLIPAHNEAENIAETVAAVLETDYPNYEVIVIDDGSTDDTGRIVEEIAARNDKVRLLVLKNNQGKAAALNYGTLLSKGEIIVTIDADCLLEARAIHWMVWHFEKFPRVGAVTGNPRVRNRTTLLAKLQTGEYASIIGLIKRTQRLLGKVLTVSGVIAAFRKQALLDVGLWDTDMVTDDINVTWKLEKRFWDVHYELNAIGWMLVPETISGLWRQRVRWAQGGLEVLRRHADIWSDLRESRLWPIYIDYMLSLIWSFAFVIFSLLWLGMTFFSFTVPGAPGASPIPLWTGSIVALVCVTQFGVSFLLDRKYDSNLFKYYFWVIWYPVVYWMFSALAMIRATPKALTKKFGTAATWQSPDRGLRLNVMKAGGDHNVNN